MAEMDGYGPSSCFSISGARAVRSIRCSRVGAVPRGGRAGWRAGEIVLVVVQVRRLFGVAQGVCVCVRDDLYALGIVKSLKMRE